MLDSIIQSWRLARGNVLRTEFSKLLAAWSDLVHTDPQEGDFVKVSLNICFKEFGTVATVLSLPNKSRKNIVKEVEKWAKKAPYGNAIGYTIFAQWVESSYLPGDQAKLVHQGTEKIIFDVYEYSRSLPSK